MTGVRKRRERGFALIPIKRNLDIWLPARNTYMQMNLEKQEESDYVSVSILYPLPQEPEGEFLQGGVLSFFFKICYL